MIRILLSTRLGERRWTQAKLAQETGIRPATINELYNVHMAVFTGQQGRNFRTVRVIIGGQQAA